MKHMKRLGLLVMASCLLVVQAEAQVRIPRFDQYPVKVEKPRINKIDFRRNRDAGTFRTRLAEGLAGGVNFVGRYVVVTWGCGTGCTNGAIIDTRTGRVLWPGEFYNIDASYGDGYADPILEYKKNSRLFIFHGIPGPPDEDAKTPPSGDYYYEWRNNGFRRLKFVEKKSNQ